MSNKGLRVIPSVGVLLETKEARELIHQHGRQMVAEGIRCVLDQLREEICSQPSSLPPDRDGITSSALARLRKWLTDQIPPGLQRVVNATGIILHTNLGRAVLPPEAIDALITVGGGFSNLEFDLSSGERGSRQAHVRSLLEELTGAEKALVVNNNAAAVLLAVNTLASGKQVVVSRGQQVEIGGSFRIPDVIRSSGAVMVEVGTTNKTRLRDYEAALTEETALLLRVHTSNFRVIGFTESVPLRELVSLGRKYNVPVMDDLGSGTLVDLKRLGVHDEPTVPESVKAGADLVTFSGDKLLGGPQCGIIVGKKDLISRIAANPLARALRIDKLCLAALEGVLRLYIRGLAWESIPSLKMLGKGPEELERDASLLADKLALVTAGMFCLSVVEDTCEAGGGSLPGIKFPGKAVALQAAAGMSVTELHDHLRSEEPPIVGRIQNERLLLNVCTLLPGDVERIETAMGRLLGGHGR